ncbi:DNA-(apurinic or apyrimidinic site) endonuclease 2 [Malaclemys terrapin pileata]|uniref:DNA-(apurinic or apyrimidinic site) endonuclease 2 n=1 Tax=Malaclemys terrapin pileata TaxID=2991368 RepID=UPI0023A9037D|nr:DNA-(apurinic or apyrimidinic site) endonuclease 2 [Malaclemys terrapin pileata]
MRLLSWNVAGLRAGPGPAGLGALGGDVICLQETRVTRDLLEEPLAMVDGYNSYFSFCRTRSGYSGVATFCKDSATPLAAEEGLSGLLARPGEGGAVGCYGDLGAFTHQELKALDSEGRAVITHHRIRTSAEQETTLTVINVYCPRADPQRPDRVAYQTSFYRLLQGRAEALLRDGGHVVILGDINTSHRPIDHCEPGDPEVFREHPGRRWLDVFLWAPDGQGLFVDTFRLLHPSQPYAFTCWRIDTGARLTNHGTRIDYVLADRALALAELRDARVLPEVPGSDHCPVLAELAATFLPAPRCPPLCTRHMPEFAGTQQKLSRFLVRVERGAGAAGGRGTCRGAGPGCSARRGRRLPRGQADLLRYFRAAQSQLGTGTAQNAPGQGGQESDQNASGHGTQEPAQDILGQVGQQEPCNGMVPRELTMGQAVGTKPSSTARWRAVLPGPAPPPCCPAHGEPCALRTVRKPGPNRGRRFYVCARPPGRPNDPRARCDFFRWAGKGRS